MKILRAIALALAGAVAGGCAILGDEPPYWEPLPDCKPCTSYTIHVVDTLLGNAEPGLNGWLDRYADGTCGIFVFRRANFECVVRHEKMHGDGGGRGCLHHPHYAITFECAQ